MKFEVEVRTPGIPGRLAVSWEWEIPAGLFITGWGSDEPPRIIVTVEPLEPLALVDP